MKIIIAPDSFKGSLLSSEVADSIEKGIKNITKKIKTIKIPIADGGEGTVEALIASMNGKIYYKNVTDPLGKKIKAFYGIIKSEKTGIIEMASASGLTLVPVSKRNPLFTTTFGTGELIKQAIADGCKKIIIGIGGSATTDGGMGMLQALGVEFFDLNGNKLGIGGKEMIKIHSINTSKMFTPLKDVEFIVASDVTNPLYGKKGASYVFGPQKGATPQIVKQLDEGLKNYAQKIKKALKKDIAKIPGTGAAGGLGGGLVAFLNSKIKSGINIIIEKTKFEEKLNEADLVITGEGNTDFQTLFGKVPVGIAEIAKKHKVPVVCLSGGLGNDLEKLYNIGITAFFSIVNHPMDLESAMKNSRKLIELQAENIIRLFIQGRSL